MRLAIKENAIMKTITEQLNEKIEKQLKAKQKIKDKKRQIYNNCIGDTLIMNDANGTERKFEILGVIGHLIELKNEDGHVSNYAL